MLRVQNTSKVDELKVSWNDSDCKHIHKKWHGITMSCLMPLPHLTLPNNQKLP